MRNSIAGAADYETWITQMASLDRGKGDWRSRNGYARRERVARAMLEAKRPEDWRRDVDMIDDRAVRARVAAIVWWDYFGDRPASSPWRHLNCYLNADYVKIDTDRLKQGLVVAGYTPWQAHKRLSATLDYLHTK